MSNLFHSSDHHLDHRNIIKYCNRPFSSVEEMTELLIQYWNEDVHPEDRVIYHGDFILSRDDERAMKLRRRMNGKWDTFIAGNHDDGPFLKDQTLADRLIVGSSNRKRRRGNAMTYTHDDIPLTASHYPFENWKIIRSGTKAWNLHGHTHQTAPFNPAYPGQINVGVDAWNFRPAPWESIKQIIDLNRP